MFAGVLTVLGGCSAPDVGSFAFGKRSEPQIGTDIVPPHHREQIADFMRTFLSNPTKVKDAFITEPALRPVGGASHYIACVRYNPRDTSDHYLGSQSHVGIFLDGRLNQFPPADPQICAGLAYQPFREAESLVP